MNMSLRGLRRVAVAIAVGALWTTLTATGARTARRSDVYAVSHRGDNM